jgi:DNA-binding NarL/FixJ family response regulator
MNKKRILFIDDEPRETSSIIDALKFERQYEIIMATTGDEALQAINNAEFDLVILDLMMPAERTQEDPAASRTTGIRIGKVIRQEFPYTPIICLSVARTRSIRDQMVRLGQYLGQSSRTHL